MNWMFSAVATRWPRAWMIAFVAFVAIKNLEAAPYVPTDDAQVLERLPIRTTPQHRELKAMQAAAAQAPGDLGRATALASAYIKVSRAEGDPRYLGYAQAALRQWWNDPDAPTSVLALRAAILQSNHHFDAALADLTKTLQRDPRNAQALLTRATVYSVQGKYAASRADCTRLAGTAPEVYAATCIAIADSLTGRARPAYDSLRRTLASAPGVDASARAWAETLLGEIADRLGDPAAETHFRMALAADPSDKYLLGAYSDWLLDRKRPADVIPLVQNDVRVDSLLLRYALAQRALRRPELAATAATLRARFDASRTRGDVIHLREEARFELHIAGDPTAALKLARRNWNEQREPADLRILAEAAAATGDAAARDTVNRWLADSGLEYPAVAAITGVGTGGPKVK